ncbi:FxSxx-COOH system tetratricopeptide repeat protein [Actinosynnema sp. CS-041913]|uniref:FxSxx-COOH system tetratricopeptide repeat protein n=1 Tax=Actinosynnema sp. CS-041913 TaxID=3239917 RepID=UPI003D8C3DFF
MPDGAQHRDLSATLAETVERGDTAVLKGVGGAGKTELVAQYVRDLWDGDELDLLAWVGGSSRESIVLAYAELGANLTGTEETVPERGAERLLEWLAVSRLRWLVVLDDVRAPNDISGLWPPATHSGRTIVTTRRPDLPTRRTRLKSITVGSFRKEEALAYLDARFADAPDGLVGAAELARDLDYLPLALASAAAHMRNVGLSCAEYRSRLNARRRAVEGRPPTGDDLRSIVGLTWSLAAEAADREAPTGLARPLLEAISVLAPSGFPSGLPAAPAMLEALSAVVGRVVDRYEVADGLAVLQRFGLVDPTPDAGSPRVRIHPLVQRAARDATRDQDLPRIARAAASALLGEWRASAGEPGQAQMLRANAEALRAVAGDVLWDADHREILVRAGTSLAADGLVSEAVHYFEDLHAEAAQRLAEDHPFTLGIRRHLAIVRATAGDVRRSVVELEELLASYSAALGPDHPDTLTTRDHLAGWRGEAGDLHGAAAEFEQVLALRSRALGEDHPATLATRGNLAFWRGTTGDLDGAATGFESLVAASTRVLGPDHPATLTARFNLARWLGAGNNVDAAITVLEQLLADQRRVLGSGHPDTMATRHGLADWRGAAGDAAGAVATMERVLADRARLLGPDHPDTMATRQSLAEWRGAAGDAAGAVEELDSLYEYRVRALGLDHPNTLIAASNLAALLRQAGNHTRARMLHEHVLDARRRVLGPDHPDTLRSAASLAVLLRQSGDYERARDLHEHVLDRRRRVLGPVHPDTLRSTADLAVALRQSGDFARARVMDETAVEGRRRALGPDHPDTVRSESALAAQDRFGVPRIFVAHQTAGRVVDEIVAGLQYHAMMVHTSGSIGPGGRHGPAAEEALTSSDLVLALVTESGFSSPAATRVIDSALSRDLPLIPVLVGVFPGEVTRMLPHGITDRRAITLDSTTPAEIDRLVESVRRVILARREVRSEQGSRSGAGRLSPDELAELRDAVAAAFDDAGRPLEHDDRRPQLLQPGPVWISAEVAPTTTEVDHFAEHLSHGRLGYLVHVGDLRAGAQIALDQMRIGGKPVVTVTARSLRAAHADQRVDAFLGELERDYGNRDNLFDTKNALINERFLFGRDVLLNTVGSALRRNEHVLVTGLRKVGKTSLLNILRQHLADRPVCQVDLQRFDRHGEDWPPTLFSLMLTAFDRWGRTEYDDWPFEPSTPTTTTALEAELDRRQQHLVRSGRPETPLVVVLDELERIYPARGEDHAARQWVRAGGALRALAQGERRHVVVIGADLRPGVNRDNDLGPAGTNPFFSFFQETPIPLLGAEAVDKMVRDLSRAMAIEVVPAEFVSRLCRLTGGHPALVRTVAAEAYRQRAKPYELSSTDLDVALDHLEDSDAVGFFLRNNLWQLMTVAEREVIQAAAQARDVAAFVPEAERKQAISALRTQGLLGDGVRIGLFRDWLRHLES